MPTPGRGILRRQRALVRRGRKLVRDTAACRDACCGGACEQFVRLVACSYGFPGPCNPQRPDIYACAASTLCMDGTPAFDGRSNLWKVDGWCHQRLPDLVPRAELPDGANILLPKHRLVCLGESDCEDDRCPRGGSYYRANPCPGVADEVGGLPEIYVCVGGAWPGCNVYDFGIGAGICYVVRTGSEVFEGDDLPPDAIRIDEAIGPGARTCCECLGGCEPVGMAESECYQIEAGATPNCCCSGDDQYQVTTYSFRYDILARPGRPAILVTGRYLSSDIATPNTGGEWCYEFFSNASGTPNTDTICEPVPTNCGFNFESMLPFFPPPGVDFGSVPCQDFEIPGNQRTEIVSWTWTHRCDYMGFSARWINYSWDGTQYVENIRGQWQMGIRRIPDPNHRCTGGCGGSPLLVLVTPGGGVEDAPGVPGAGGCSGCGQGQSRTPVG